MLCSDCSTIEGESELSTDQQQNNHPTNIPTLLIPNILHIYKGIPGTAMW